MFILLNGSFGIGKTSAATLFVEQVPGASLFDPEVIGFVLRRLPPVLLGRKTQPDDYQDLALWRRLIVFGARRRHARAPVVIVPMSFTNLSYLDAFAEALARTAPVHRYCLVATLEVVRARLDERASRQGRSVTTFELRRSAECVAAHRDPRFGAPIDATGPPEDIVAQLRARTGL